MTSLLGCRPCPKILAPVCGRDGETYSNACEAKCKETKVECDGECPCKPCLCPKLLQPVCGLDGETYSNACKARCKGAKVECDGNCPCIVPKLAK